MLSRFDDYPVHQTPEPLVRRASGDRNVYDRYWLNGIERDGGFYFGIALGLYPNLGVMDTSLSLSCEGVQHAFHASRRAPSEPTDTRVGPLRLEILEPLASLRVVLESNATGIACDLRFDARTPAIEEARTTRYQEERVMMDMTRFCQFGRWQGWIEAAGERTDVRADAVYGTRDRSWGLRPVGETAPGRPGPIPQVCWLWAPLHFERHCTVCGYFQEPDGEIWYADGTRVDADRDGAPAALEPGDPARPRWRPVGQRVRFQPGSRWVAQAALQIEQRDGDAFEIELEPLLRFQMKGLGYGHPEWSHGHWKGEESIGGESWKLDEVDPTSPFEQHIHQLCRARIGSEVGVGTLEQVILGAYPTFGFREFLDVSGSA